MNAFKSTVFRYAIRVLVYSFCLVSCHSQSLRTAAARMEAYLPKLEGRSIAVVANHSSILTNSSGGYTHLVDTLLSRGIQITRIFSPEHGFRGTADAGEKIQDSKDSQTGLSLVSLYGSHYKPQPEDLQGVNLVLFDLQDVGVRFYTYLSTLHYVMEACAEQGIPIIVLDRPNPNGSLVDGPLLEPELTSFVGLHPVPIAYGMTIGEYALMINGESWLKKGVKAKLEVIPMENYSHDTPYVLPVPPSPNLPNAQAIGLYPSLCLFEGTPISVGRGTDYQFQVFGSPLFSITDYPFSFTPKPNVGSKHPLHEGQQCFGLDLRKEEIPDEIHLAWLLDSYKHYKAIAKDSLFFNPFFAKLAGSTSLQRQIEEGRTEAEIKASWKKGLESFKTIRERYLLYP